MGEVNVQLLHEALDLITELSPECRVKEEEVKRNGN